MNAGWLAVFIGLAYVCTLFAVAYYGDRYGKWIMASRLRPVIYALTLGVYCTSWTFFGSVGVASSSGLDFLPIYIGPIIIIGLFFPLILRIVRLAKGQNITSVADFVASRYGKSDQVAALVAIIAVVGVLPYIALQLKAVAASMTMVLQSMDAGKAVAVSEEPAFLGLIVAILLAGFAMAFGTRNIDATENQDGLVLAVAMESLVKLAAFLAVGVFVTWWMFSGLDDLNILANATPAIKKVLNKQPDPAVWVTTTLLAACCIILLPRQFHVAVVENRDEKDIRTAAWLFPLYLVLINVFVIPLAIAGLLTFAPGTIDRDLTVLALPLQAQNKTITILAMIGGLSAATAMVIVASIALSIMVSNDLAMPVILRRRARIGSLDSGNPAAQILLIRRVAIILIISLAFIYLHLSSDAALASIGLMSFAAIAQIAPAFFGGLFWRGANARGAMAGLIAGISLWVYTLLLPSLATASTSIAALVAYGPLGIAPLKPTALFGLELPQLVHGVLVSLTANIMAYIGFSLTRTAAPIERLQANIFIGRDPVSMAQSLRLWRAGVTAGELETVIARYLGQAHTRTAFENFQRSRGLNHDTNKESDIQLVRFAEHLLASGIGAPSSRMVLSLLLSRSALSRDAALALLDEASANIQQNRDLLQHALDHARQGITVFDQDLQLVCWNREFCELFGMPKDLMHTGMGLEEMVRFNALRGIYGPGGMDDHIGTRLELLVNEREPMRLRLHPDNNVIEVRSARMPDGGLVTTYTDVTQAVATEEALEQRVAERTEQLQHLNQELAAAKALAEEANISKTRFLAAASHDILQPLNAARLYATSLVERQTMTAAQTGQQGVSNQALLGNLDLSLHSVEEILTTLLDISRFDAGAMKTQISAFPIKDVFEQLQVEFYPAAAAAGLKLSFAPSSLHIRSDRRLFRRLLQNLVSNAIKYTTEGRILVGCRRQGQHVRIDVADTGSGIPEPMQRMVFREFERLSQSSRNTPGLGLGLSIVERISKALDHRVELQSIHGRGSRFSVIAPMAEPDTSQTEPAANNNENLAKPLSGMRILAIDNEPHILQGLNALLGGWNCVLATAPGMESALAAVTSEGFLPDAIIADYHLDEGDGIEAIDALRKAIGIEVPAVLITADHTPEVRQRAEQHEVKVLNKPVRPAALRSLLSQWRVMHRAAE
jgi:Na+/proline symporter/signal transduction histidine kinase